MVGLQMYRGHWVRGQRCATACESCARCCLEGWVKTWIEICIASWPTNLLVPKCSSHPRARLAGMALEASGLSIDGVTILEAVGDHMYQVLALVNAEVPISINCLEADVC